MLRRALQWIHRRRVRVAAAAALGFILQTAVAWAGALWWTSGASVGVTYVDYFDSWSGSRAWTPGAEWLCMREIFPRTVLVPTKRINQPYPLMMRRPHIVPDVIDVDALPANVRPRPAVRQTSCLLLTGWPLRSFGAGMKGHDGAGHGGVGSLSPVIVWNGVTVEKFASKRFCTVFAIDAGDILPLRLIPFGAVVNSLFFATLAFVALSMRPEARRWVRRIRRRCAQCGYALAGADVCPECGSSRRMKHQRPPDVAERERPLA